MHGLSNCEVQNGYSCVLKTVDYPPATKLAAIFFGYFLFLNAQVLAIQARPVKKWVGEITNQILIMMIVTSARATSIHVDVTISGVPIEIVRPGIRVCILVGISLSTVGMGRLDSY